MTLAHIDPQGTAVARPGTFTEGEIETLKRTIAHDLTNDELNLFAAVCNRTRLDPFAKQIYAIKRTVKRRVKNDRGNWVDTYEDVLTIQTGIDGYRLIAERSRLYGGQDQPEWCGADGVWTDVWLSDEPPSAARVAVYRKDVPRPFVGVAKFDSYADRWPAKEGQKLGDLRNLWKTMPEGQIAKCAEALALRKAFPNDLSGVYVAEEMDQANNVRPIDTGAREGISERDFDEIREAASMLTDEQRGELHAWCEAEGIKVARARLTSENAGRVLQRVLDLARGAMDVPSGPATPAPSSPVTSEPVGSAAAGSDDGTGGAPPAPGAVTEVSSGEGGSTGNGDPAAAAADSPIPAGSGDTGGEDGTHGDTNPPDRPAPSGAATTLKEINPSGYNSLVRYCRKMKAEHFSSDKETSDAQWEALAWSVSGGRTVQVRELDPEEAADFRRRIGDLANGRSRWVESDDPQFLGWDLVSGEER